MNRYISGVSALALSVVWGCGPSMAPEPVKSPEERIAEQEWLAYEDEQKQSDDIDQRAIDEYEQESQAGEFDEEQAKKELQRATFSAESCTGVVESEKDLRGDTEVNITFQPDGTVTDASIPAPYAETKLGDCVLNAYKAVIVPPFAGGPHSVTWKVSLKDQPKEAKK